MSGMIAYVFGQPQKVKELIAEFFGDLDPLGSGMQGILQKGETTFTSWDGD